METNIATHPPLEEVLATAREKRRSLNLKMRLDIEYYIVLYCCDVRRLSPQETCKLFFPEKLETGEKYFEKRAKASKPVSRNYPYLSRLIISAKKRGLALLNNAVNPAHRFEVKKKVDDYLEEICQQRMT